ALRPMYGSGAVSCSCSLLIRGPNLARCHRSSTYRPVQIPEAGSVEIAHEVLITQWPWLQNNIHRSGVGYAFLAALNVSPPLARMPRPRWFLIRSSSFKRDDIVPRLAVPSR